MNCELSYRFLAQIEFCYRINKCNCNFFESLSKIILDKHLKGLISRYQYSLGLSPTHLLFVEDVIVFGASTVKKWDAYKDALDLFCSATGMMVNTEKSSFMYLMVDDGTRGLISTFLPYYMEPITSGFKYPGFRLKPLGYRSSNWLWMVKRFDDKIRH